MKKVFLMTALAAVCSVMTVGDSFAQNQQRRFDPEQMVQRTMDRLSETMNATDEEWSAIEPKLAAVVKIQSENRIRGFRGGRRGGGGGGQQAAQRNPEAASLRAALDSGDAADIKAKLKDLREARKAQAKDLDKARGELAKVVNPEQEAYLVLFGILE